MDFLSVDFETYYGKDYSVSDRSVHEYVNDKRFDAYLVAVHGYDFHWVGHPKDFDWQSIAGKTWLMHNASFDWPVYRRLVELGIVPSVTPGKIRDTADMTRYFRLLGNLQNATFYLLHMEMDKGPRAFMKDKVFAELNEADKQMVIRYAGVDAALTYLLWELYNERWPECEQRLSEENFRSAVVDGIHVNYDLATRKLRGELVDGKVVEGVAHLLHKALQALPWVDDGDKPLSPKAIVKQCEKCGITPPSSFDKKNPELQAFFNENKDKHAWVSAILDYRSINTLNTKLTNLLNGLDSEGRFAFSSMYFGAHTGRFSAGSKAERGDGGSVNMYNLPSRVMYGLDFRKLFTPPPDHSFVILDFAQVEARYVLWLAGEEGFIEDLKKTGNLYQSFAARASILKPGTKNMKKEDPNGYAFSKETCLAGGFGMGPKRFFERCQEKAGDLARPVPVLAEVTPEMANDLIYNKYRGTFPKVVAYWKKQMDFMRFSAEQDDDMHEIQLKSGRWLTYWHPKSRKVTRKKEVDGKKVLVDDYSMSAYPVLGGELKYFHGGLLTENIVQASCRDLMRDSWLRIVDAYAALGVKVSFTVYDELVISVPNRLLDKALLDQVAAKGQVTIEPDVLNNSQDFIADMRRTVLNLSGTWAEGFPLDTGDVVVSSYYVK